MPSTMLMCVGPMVTVYQANRPAPPPPILEPTPEELATKVVSNYALSLAHVHDMLAGTLKRRRVPVTTWTHTWLLAQAPPTLPVTC